MIMTTMRTTTTTAMNVTSSNFAARTTFEIDFSPKRRAYYNQQDVIIDVCLTTKGQRAGGCKQQDVINAIRSPESHNCVKFSFPTFVLSKMYIVAGSRSHGTVTLRNIFCGGCWPVAYQVVSCTPPVGHWNPSSSVCCTNHDGIR